MTPNDHCFLIGMPLCYPVPLSGGWIFLLPSMTKIWQMWLDDTPNIRLWKEEILSCDLSWTIAWEKEISMLWSSAGERPTPSAWVGPWRASSSTAWTWSIYGSGILTNSGEWKGGPRMSLRSGVLGPPPSSWSRQNSRAVEASIKSLWASNPKVLLSLTGFLKTYFGFWSFHTACGMLVPCCC